MASSGVNGVPLLDLKKQYEQVGPAIEEKVISVLRSGSYILGKLGAQLEEDVAALCGAEYGVGVANGTDALILALWAANVGPGDEVITPPFTFAATAEAIALRGATPVFVDVDSVTFNLNPSLLEAAITPRTKAIMPVHLYGQPADMEPIMEVARRHGLMVIEDNAQAIGAEYKGRPTGSFGDMACISFYPTKNLGAAGDAGMVVTSNPELAARLRRLRAHGSDKRYHHEELGVNSRLDEMQAAVLLSKMPYIRQWNAQRDQVANWYAEELKSVPGVLIPSVMPQVQHVWHQYTVRVSTNGPVSRDEFVQLLAERGIGSMCYYPIPLHLQKAFSHYGYKEGSFPVSELLAKEVVSLPMYPELARIQVRTVCKAIADIISTAMPASRSAVSASRG